MTFLDFRSIIFEPTGTNLTERLSWLLNEVIGVEHANEAIRALTHEESGTEGLFLYHSALVNSTTILQDFEQQVVEWQQKNPGKPLPAWADGPGVCLTCGRIGSIHIGVANLSISGLDSVLDFTILQPYGPSSLHNNVTAGNLRLSVDLLFQVDGAPPPDGSGPPLHIDDDFSLTLDLDLIVLVIDILLKIDQNQFYDLGIGQLSDVLALASTLAAARPETLSLQFARAGVFIDCRRCSSPLLSQTAESLRAKQSTSEGVADVTASINEFLDNVNEHFTRDPNVQRQFELQLCSLGHATDVCDELEAEMQRENAANCTDFDGPICFVWWSMLQCDSNPAYMNQHCRLSCGQCTTLTDDSDEDFSFLGFLAGLALVVVVCAAIALFRACVGESTDTCPELQRLNVASTRCTREVHRMLREFGSEARVFGA